MEIKLGMYIDVRSQKILKARLSSLNCILKERGNYECFEIWHGMICNCDAEDLSGSNMQRRQCPEARRPLKNEAG